MQQNPNRIIPVEIHVNFPMGGSVQPVEPMYQTAPAIADTFCGPPTDPICFGAGPSLYTSANRGKCFVIGVAENQVLSTFATQSKLSEQAIAAVGINRSWNANIRTVSGSVKVKFESTPGNGDYRIGLYVVEDSVTGPHPNYSQYDDADPVNSPVQGFAHPWVLRGEVLNNSFWGKTGFIPASPQVNVEYSAPFSYTVPEKYYDIPPKPAHLSLVAFVVKKVDQKNGMIYNCETIAVVGNNSSVAEHLENCGAGKAVVYRINKNTFSLTVPAGGPWKLSIINHNGRIIREADVSGDAGNRTVSCEGIARGVYAIMVRGVAGMSVNRILVE